MVNNNFTKALADGIKKTKLNQELDPGSVDRRYEPSGGISKHNERIHRESKWVDDNMNLPFKFSKPKKAGRSAVVMCCNCGHVISASINTVGIICSECKQYSKVEKLD